MIVTNRGEQAGIQRGSRLDQVCEELASEVTAEQLGAWVMRVAFHWSWRRIAAMQGCKSQSTIRYRFNQVQRVVDARKKVCRDS